MILSEVEHYLQLMEDALKNKDIDSFNRYLGNAEAISADPETITKISCLRAKGLYFLRRFDSAMKAIEEALKYPQSETDRIRLLRSKACILTYQGQFKESILQFKKLLTETSEPQLLVEISLNMAWSLLESYKKDPHPAILDEVEMYLDTTYNEIEILNNSAMKRNIFANYAEYFKLKGDFDQCIEMLEKGLTYRSEEQLAKAYSDLAEIHMQRKSKGDFELAEKFLQEAELIATKYGNEMELAYINYLRGLIKMNASDFVQVLDCLYTAYTGFMGVGALSYAMDCYNEICEVSQSLRNEFVSTFQDTLKINVQDHSEKEII